MKIQKKNFILITVIVIFFFSYGILVGHYNIFPFEILSTAKNTIYPKSEISPRIQIHQDINEIEKLISLQNSHDILMKKHALTEYIWNNSSLPNNFPVQHDIDISDNLSNLENLKRIDSFTVEMDYGMNSISYLFLADNSNNNLIIYHQGDDSKSSEHFDNHSFEEDRRIIQYFLNENYSVLIFSMVGHGMNNEPIVEIKNIGKIRLNSHEHFELLETETFHPIKFFLEPVIVTLNQIDVDYSFNSYHMLGKNEGGWTTIMISALDERIKQSFSVAGSFPLWMSPSANNFGGYEHHLLPLYQIANYLELYTMSAYGDKRSLILFYNEFDPCCFTGKLYEKYPFGDSVASTLKSIGSGKFNVIIDYDQTKNIISDYTLDYIKKSLSD